MDRPHLRLVVDNAPRGNDDDRPLNPYTFVAVLAMDAVANGHDPDDVLPVVEEIHDLMLARGSRAIPNCDAYRELLELSRED